MKMAFLRCLCWALVGLALVMASIAPSQARMGGGHSYSSGSSSSSSRSSSSSSSSSRSSSGGGIHWGGSSSSGSGYSSPGSGGYVASGSGQYEEGGNGFLGLVEIIILLLVIYVLYRLLAESSVVGVAKTFQAAAPGRDTASVNLDAKLLELKARDGNFSKVLLLDFASLLYHKFHTFRGTGQFKLLAPYLSKSIIEQTTGNVFYSRQSVHGIVIGKVRIINIAVRDQADTISVEFESNLSLRYQTGEETRLANQEQWTFSRQAGALSPPPGQMRNLSCPSCGAPADFTDAGECQYCHSFIQAGEKQWQVVDMRLVNTEKFKIEEPAAYVEESGTDLPTIQQADLASQRQAFLQNRGFSDWAGFFDGFKQQVVEPYFLATYAAWSRGDWQSARHLVSDRLYESNKFWMEEYARQGWRNRLEDIQILDVTLARIDLDKFYESLTVRVFASCLDYTVDKQGKLLGGSKKTPRQFSEYWTFIRAAGAENSQTGYDIKTCPACGAPADKVGQAGECGYCGSKLTEGQFSWVLAIITQDEVYEG